MCKQLIMALVLITLSGFAFALNMEIHTIKLQHNLAKVVIPKLKPFFSPGAIIEPNGNQIIIKTTAANFAQIQSLIKSLDIAPTQLIVSLRRGNHGHTVTGTNSSNTKRYATTSREQRNNLQSVKVNNGEKAFFATGKSIMTVDQTQTFPAITTTSIKYKDIVSGFWVQPQVMGEKVKVDIKQQNQRLSHSGGSNIDLENTSTTLTIPFGQWVHISGIDTYQQAQKNSTQYSTVNSICTC